MHFETKVKFNIRLFFPATQPYYYYGIYSILIGHRWCHEPINGQLKICCRLQKEWFFFQFWHCELWTHDTRMWWCAIIIIKLIIHYSVRSMLQMIKHQKSHISISESLIIMRRLTRRHWDSFIDNMIWLSNGNRDYFSQIQWQIDNNNH